MTPEDEAAYEALFAGNKRKVLPVGEALLGMVDELGGPVEVGVARLYVWFATADRQFALFFPASGRRVTLRLRLDGTVPGGGRIDNLADSHPDERFDIRVHLADPAEVDDEIRELLDAARELAS